MAFGASLVALVIGIGFPSRDVTSDAFDELLAYEGPDVPYVWKHPAADVSLWALFHALRACGWSGRSLGLTTFWNAAFMALAFAGVWVLGFRSTRSALSAYAATLLLASCHMSLSWLRDPFLPYWPPSLALVTWMLVGVGNSEARPRTPWFVGPALLGGLAALFNPMSALAVAAIAATGAMKRRSGRSRWHTVQSAAMLATVALCPLLIVWLKTIPPHAFSNGSGIYGHFRPRALTSALVGLRASLVAPGRTPALELLSGLAWDGLLVVSAWWLIRSGLRGVRQAAPLFLAALGHAVFVAWWDVEQLRFWLLVPWLCVLGALTNIEVAGKRVAVLSLVAGALILSANLLSSVLPSLRAPPPSLLAARMQRTFGDRDLLVFAVWADASLPYFGSIPNTGWLSLHAALEDRRPDDRAFDWFIAMQRWVTSQGGRTYVEVDREGRPIVAEDVLQAPSGVTRTDLARIVWGLTLAAGPWRFREVLQVLGHTPCAAASPAVKGSRGLSAAATSFVDSGKNRDYAPERAIDAQNDTEWLSTEPFAVLDVHFEQPRAVEGIELRSASNAPYRDFAARLVQVSLWNGATPLSERRVGLARGKQGLGSVELPAERATCLSIVLVEHAGRGGGLAEVVIR